MAFNEKTVSDLAEKLGLPEVLEQFRSADVPADGVNPLAEKLGTLHVFGQAQLEERLNNEKAAAAEDARKTAVGNTYGAMDKRILAETGIAKADGESTVDYMARAAKEKFGKPGNESEVMQRLRTDLEETRSALQKRNTEYEQLEVKHATEAKTLQINSRLDMAINTLPIDAPTEKLDSQRRFLKYELEQKYSVDVVDGRVEFTDKATGKVVKNPTTQTPLTEAEIIAQFAPTVVSLKQTSQKRGTGVQSSSHNNNQDADLSEFTSLDDYKKHLTESGVTLSSQAGQDKIAAYIAARDKK
ncbi:hypothetical protein DNI29_04435 [Hymenobacter sediminis]|uniref:hypothetical protein n=1 Tax=Hymenobacter sediminis TaxID=2218621 RepID=UPI000DA6B16E|nr:hypothetical protein [Hymenobacter sediminis]RPD50050.1 hypothetical protein DNI29_04435 [Hymenobacter sediminis]